MQILGLQIAIMKILVIIIDGNVKIQRYILFCDIVNSAKQSTYQLLLLLPKKFHTEFHARSYELRATSYEVQSTKTIDLNFFI